MPFTTLDLSKQSGTSLPSSITSASGLSTGKILQVQSTTLATEQSSTSDSYVDTSLTVNLTPSATSSKVLVMVAHGMGYTSSGTESKFKLLRDSSTVDEYIVNMGLSGSGGGSAVNFLVSPNTTSQITFKVMMRRSTGSGTVYICANDTVSTITAMEVGA